MSQEKEIAAEFVRRMDKMFEETMFGGYPPGYDRRNGMPGTLKIGRERRCLDCGPIICCWRHMPV